MSLRSADDIFETIKRRITAASSRLPDDKRPILGWSATPVPDLEYALFRLGQAGIAEELYYQIFASKLAGFAEWTGKPLTQDDVPGLGDTFREVDPETFDVGRYNQYVYSADLEEWARGQGKTRIPATRATGEVRVFVRNDSITVADGTLFETGGGSGGQSVTTDTGSEPLRYEAIGDHQPAVGESAVTVPIRGVSGGIAWNVVAGAIDHVPAQRAPTGDIEGVLNNNPVTGGEAAETDPELRERARRTLEYNADGVTEQAFVAKVYHTYREEYSIETDDLAIVPYRDPADPDSERAYPYADFYVDGGPPTADVQALADDWAFPLEINVKAPTRHPLAVEATLRTTKESTTADIAVERAENATIRFLSEFGIGEGLSIQRLTATIMNADFEDIGDIDDLSVTDQATGTTVPPGTDIEAEIGPYDKIVSGGVTFSVGER